MSKLPTIKTILSGFFSTGTLNNNFTVLRDAFNNTLSRDGSTPNTMEADIDLNSHDLLNVGKITADDITVAGEPLAFQEGIAEVNAIAVEVEQARLDAQAAAQAAQDAENSLLEWAGPWTTAVTYAPSDLVIFDGSTYVCVIAHTSGVFATDFGAGKWQLFASKGSPGAGTGDMLAANNLSELANKDTALTNLGGTVTGKALFKTTDASTARTTLGLGFGATAPLASQAEAEAGTDNTKVVTPLRVAEETTARIATQLEAETGTDNTKLMTPLRVAQEIAAKSSNTTTLLGTLSTSSGSSQTLTGLNLSSYNFLLIHFRGVDPTSSGTNAHDLSVASVEVGRGREPLTLSAIVELSNGWTSTTAGASSDLGGQTALRKTSTSVTVSSTDNFAGGSIAIYGVK